MFDVYFSIFYISNKACNDFVYIEDLLKICTGTISEKSQLSHTGRCLGLLYEIPCGLSRVSHAQPGDLNQPVTFSLCSVSSCALASSETMRNVDNMRFELTSDWIDRIDAILWSSVWYWRCHNNSPGVYNPACDIEDVIITFGKFLWFNCTCRLSNRGSAY